MPDGFMKEDNVFDLGVSDDTQEMLWDLVSKLPVEVYCEDNGIGSYDYGGAVGRHTDIRYYGEGCGEVTVEWESSEDWEPEYAEGLRKEILGPEYSTVSTTRTYGDDEREVDLDIKLDFIKVDISESGKHRAVIQWECA